MSYMVIAERQALLTAEFAAAKRHSALVQALERTTRAFGMSHFSFIHAPSPQDLMLAPLIIETSMSLQFLRDFDRSQMLRSCPILARMRDSVMPQTWHMVDRSHVPALDFPLELRAMLPAQQLPMGVAIPINATHGQRLVFWFLGNRAGLSQAELNELCMIMLQALDSYNCIVRNGGAVQQTLSARELEIVRWTGQGKTSIEIGQILSLSDHTVNAYMTNAIKKLDCVNRTQLVAKAIRLKLIN
jgi:DNA-binding CsgD family transcriptional regulator